MIAIWFSVWAQVKTRVTAQRATAGLYQLQFFFHIKLLPLTTVGLQSMCAHVNWFLGVCPCSLSIGPSFHCVSFSFTSLALWTSHTSEVTSKHASPQPGAIKSLRQWKTGEEKWLDGSLYSHWLFNPSVVPPKGEYEEILMYFIKYKWKSCFHVNEYN